MIRAFESGGETATASARGRGFPLSPGVYTVEAELPDQDGRA